MDDTRFDEPAQVTGQRMAKTNQAVQPTKCRTCGGDRFVAVNLRAVVQTPWMKSKGITPPKGAAIEEYAPCPDCNAEVDTSFHRADGTVFRSPDPAITKEYLRR